MPHLLDKYVHYYRSKGPVVMLESQSPDHPAAVTSYLAACPRATIKARGNSVEINAGGKTTTRTDNPWSALQAFREQWDEWVFGYLGYDLKNHIEDLESANPDVLNAPDLFFMVPGVLMKVDSHSDEVEMLRGAKPDISPDAANGQGKLDNLHSTVTEKDYVNRIKEAQQEIYEGTYYEINLSHQLQGNYEGDPFQLYKRMRSSGPVPFGSFMAFGEFAICSLSPERFLRREGDTVYSQPIKGTMKRDADPGKDEKLKRNLIESSKERAENLMIVDLVRNDLSRIARPDSVEVSNLFEVQTFGTVHQMVSTVQAQTEQKDPVEIIKACYPMGSMTGAPKISAMQWIEKLENYRRGIYSGGIGYVTPGGDFDFNVVIRTAIIKNGLLCYAVGGAITSDSDPRYEWEETLLKARALTASME